MTISLTPADRKSLTDAVHGAARANMTAGPTDRAQAEADVAALYAAAGFSRPAFIWYDSPLALGLAEIYRTFELPFAKKMPQTASILQTIQESHAHDIIHISKLEAMLAPAQKAGVLDCGRSLATDLAALVTETSARANAGAEGLVLLRRQLLLESPDRRLHIGMSNFMRRLATCLPSILQESPCAPVMAATFAFDEQLAALLGKEAEKNLLQRMRRLSLNAWCVPYERVCLMAARPEKLSCDTQGFIHNETGPALAYAGDLDIYFFKGIAVPQWAVLIPAKGITWNMIWQLERKQQAETAQVLSLRFEGDKWYQVVETNVIDNYGRLHSISRPWMPAIKTLHVVNSTPEPDGTFKEYKLRVPPWMQTPVQAVAWTFDMRPEEYLKTQRMT
ncbi:MAG: DUF6745 domain-containing protein [Alphaproteobacteria bacterium]